MDPMDTTSPPLLTNRASFVANSLIGSLPNASSALDTPLPSPSPSPPPAPSPSPGASPPPGSPQSSPTPSQTTPDPAQPSELARLARLNAQAEARLRALEADITAMEAAYIKDTWAMGNAMRGWDGYVRRVDKRAGVREFGNGSGTATGAPKTRKVRPSDRVFSLSSSTAVVPTAMKRGGPRRKRGK